MRIAQVAPLYESVPPKYYGGTERVVSYLTEELVRQGHDVTLFASGCSQTNAKLVSPCRKALRLTESKDPLAYHLLMLERVIQMSDDFEIIHFHIDYMHFPFSRRAKIPNLTTLHGRLDLKELVGIYKEFTEMPVVSISDSQRKPLPWINWQATVYHGLPEDLYSLNKQPGKYLAFLGRISPEKRVDHAVQIAKMSGIPLKIAAKVDPVDKQYFKSSIEPLFSDPLVEYLGEIGEPEKKELLGNAIALLFPIDWPEPFGMVVIEAMACGTPVIAFRRGSVPEILDDGITGFVVDDIEQAVEAVGKIPNLSRTRCRQVFEKRFSVTRMAQDYVEVYRSLAENADFTGIAGIQLMRSKCAERDFGNGLWPCN